jgi:ubiquinone/menaquinone biosynthesis C-methylase UbiE
MHSLARNLLSGPGSLTILDWGIGCGRVAVPLKRWMNPDARVIGVDVDRVNVAWCNENLPDIEASLCDFFPPLEFRSSSIDMVYGISVMTHLTEGAQYAWLKELHRILKPGGICALTTHGEYAFLRHWDFLDRRIGRLVVNQINSVGISDIIIDDLLGGQLDMKRYYRGTFQHRWQVEEQWSKFLKIVAYYPAGLDARQDIVEMRKE